MALQLWTQKYRPRGLDDYVWRDLEMRATIEDWLAKKALPHCLFSGTQGTGKTSLALMLLDLLEIPQEDVLKINASRERKVDELQDKIINFIDAWAFNETGLKYIFLDEADKLSPHAQGMLRAEIERYSDSCRFIFCCNYPNKIIPALHSRLQEIKFVKLDEDDFILRAADVLVKENINFEPETLVEYKNRTYPDLRKCINLLQQNSRDGKLAPPREEDAATKDYLLDVVSLFKAGKYLEGRKLIIEQANPEEYDEVYRYFYQNLSLFGTTQSQQDEALLAIRKALVYDVTVADRELNLAAAIVELTQIATAGV